MRRVIWVWEGEDLVQLGTNPFANVENGKSEFSSGEGEDICILG